MIDRALKSLCHILCTARAQAVHTIALSVALTFSLALPAAAQQVPVPEGCVPQVTVHRDACVVQTIFFCGDDQVTHVFDRGRWIVLQVLDADRATQSYAIEGRWSATLDRPADSERHRLLPELRESGVSEAKGTILFNSGVIRDRLYQLTGTATLGDETVSYGDETFRKGEMTRRFETKSGKTAIEFNLDILVSEERDLMIESVTSRQVATNPVERVGEAIRKVAFEGDAGFLAALSDFGCD